MLTETTPSLYAIKLIETLRGEGVNCLPLIQHCGLTARQLQDPEHPLEIDRYLSLVDAGLAACQRPDLGFLVGEHTGTLEHGALGYALLSSATLKESLLRYTRYQSVLGPLLEVTLEIEHDSARMRVTPRQPYARMPTGMLRYFLQEWLATWNPWSGFIGREPPFFNAVTLGEDDRQSAGVYRQHLGCPVDFKPGQTIATFPAANLESALQYTGQTIGAFCHQQCELLLEAQQLAHGLTADIHRCLARRPGHVPDMETVSSQLNMTSRTLRRHLLRENTRFQDVVVSHRIAMARRYLSETSLPANEIAGLVGYADPANFYRTFRRMEGMAPQAYRARGQA